MPKCVNCGSSGFELWSLSGRIEDVEKDGSSLVCKDCGRMQPDNVLREMVADMKKRAAEKANSQEQKPQEQGAPQEPVARQHG